MIALFTSFVWAVLVGCLLLTLLWLGPIQTVSWLMRRRAQAKRRADSTVCDVCGGKADAVPLWSGRPLVLTDQEQGMVDVLDGYDEGGRYGD